MSGAKKGEEAPGVRTFKPYPEYVDSGTGWLSEIPSRWTAVRLKRLFTVVSGSTPESGVPENWDGEVPWVTPEDLGELDGCEIETTRRRITEAGYQSCGTTLVPSGSLVLSTRAPIGHLAIAGRALCTNQGCRSLVFRRNSNQKFFFFQLIAARSELASLGRGSTFRELAKDKLEELFVAEPPLSDQDAIVVFLDRETAKIDALVAKKERLIELLKEQRTALITRAVTKGLNTKVSVKGTDIEWLAEIPAHWDVKRVKDLSRFVTSGSRGWAQHYTDEGALFLRIGNLTTTSIDLDMTDVQHVTPPSGAEGERTRVRNGDVVVSITALIGAVAVIPDGTPDAFVNQHLALIRPSKEVDSRWLGYCLASPVGQEQLRSELYGGAKDGLSLDDVRSLVALIPPRREQEEIVTFLDRASEHIDALLANVRVAITRLTELRSALISATVTGKIDVRSVPSVALPDVGGAR